MDTAGESPLPFHLMSLIGYRDLSTLKARLLPADLGDDSAWDDDISAIGLGVAAEFDRFTGRILRRTAGVKLVSTADVSSVVLTSYPVETVTSVSLVSGGIAEDLTASIQGLHKTAGIIHFVCEPGDQFSTLEITSTGGYWCDDGEAMPVGATPLPDDLLQAWFQQCRAVCDAEATFRQKGAGNNADKDKRDASLRMDTLTLLPGVRRTLQLYLRIP
jgi:hypothetical protein